MTKSDLLMTLTTISKRVIGYIKRESSDTRAFHDCRTAYHREKNERKKRVKKENVKQNKKKRWKKYNEK